MSTTMTPPAESSPAPAQHTTVEVPQGAARAEWLKTGRIEEPKADPAPAKEPSAEGKTPEEKTAPASEPGKKQEQRSKSNAETRLSELLEDLRRAGYSPSELKTLRREATKVDPPKAEPEHTAKPTGLQAPVKPNPKDFEDKTWSEYEAAKDKYNEDFADYKAKLAVQEFRDQQKAEAVQKELRTKLDNANKRYGDEATATIGKTSQEIFNDAKIPGVVKAMLDDSPVLVDVLYALGSDEKSLTDFLESARSNPSAAVRKLVLVEKFVMEELSKGSDSGADETAGRGADGKFVAAKPEKKQTEAPPPPKEVSGRGAPPPDPVKEALRTGDARPAIDAMNRERIRKLKGN